MTDRFLDHELIRIPAIEVTPYHHALPCTVEGRPMIIDIVYRRWRSDGKRIVFGLDTHSTFSAGPDEMLPVVKRQVRTNGLGSILASEDFLAQRPGKVANDD